MCDLTSQEILVTIMKGMIVGASASAVSMAILFLVAAAVLKKMQR